MPAYQAGAARVSSTVTKRNPRPRKYASASERQAAYRARAPEVCFRAEAKTVETLDQIAQTLDQPRADVLLSMTKFALANHDWARFGLTHKPLPYGYGLAEQEFVGPRLSNPSAYADPALWEHSKQMAVERLGGHSARAMQLAGKIYRAAGGKYLGKRTKAQKSLEQWTAQDWTTKSGKPSRETGERYLPREVIEGLTPAEYGATTRAKRKGTAAGQQFVKQPKRIAAKVAALKANPTMKKPTPAQLAARARFAEMARSGAFKRKAKRKTNPVKVDLDAWMQEYRNLEDANMHSENLVRLAELVGNQADIKLAKTLLKNRDARGYLDNADYRQQYELNVKLAPKLQKMLVSADRETNPAKRKANPATKGATYYVHANLGYGQSQHFKVTASPGANSIRSAANQVANHLGYPVFVSSRNERPTSEGLPVVRYEFIDDAQTKAVDLFVYPVKREGLKYATIKTNPAKKTVSQKISQLVREGYPQKQAIAIALNEERAGKVKRNPRAANPATGTKKSRTKLNPVQYRDIAKDTAPARVQYAVHLADRPSYQAMAYFTKKADALAVAKEAADRTGKSIAVSRVQVHFGPM